MLNQHIVVSDPTNAFPDGAIVIERDIQAIADAGGCTLPCIAEDFLGCGFSAFAKRAWGDGFPMPSMAPQHFAPLAVYKPRAGATRVHWSARLVPNAATNAHVMAGGRLDGNVRLASQPGRGNLLSGTIGDAPGGRPLVVGLHELGKLDVLGGWTIKGSGMLSSGPEGFYGLSLYGFGPGVRAAFVAVSLTP